MRTILCLLSIIGLKLFVLVLVIHMQHGNAFIDAHLSCGSRTGNLKGRVGKPVAPKHLFQNINIGGDIQHGILVQVVQRASYSPIPPTGNEETDPVIAKGEETLRQIRAANAAIPDPHLSSQLDQLEGLCYQIFKTVSERPEKAGQIRKFMSYYLPTTLKMLSSYTTMQNRGVSSTNLAEARQTLYRGMDMVITACQAHST